MVERYKTAYIESRRVRMLVSLGLVIWGIVLYALAGGFPPWAWRFLIHVVTQLPHLWGSQGAAIVVPLVGLVLLSLSLFILWSLLVVAVYKVVLYWWHHLHEHEHFSMDLREAERMADEAVSEISPVPELDEFAQRWQPAAAAPTVPMQQDVRPQPVPVRQQRPYAVAHASRVVGGSGLIRVPSAVAYSDDDTPFPDEAPTQAAELRSVPMSVQMQTAGRRAMEPSTLPMSTPTKAMPRVPVEPRTNFAPPMQAMQPVARQMGGRAPTVPLLAPSPVPQAPPTMPGRRDQLRLVPRVVEDPEPADIYDTIPIVPDMRAAAVHDTLPVIERKDMDALKETIEEFDEDWGDEEVEYVYEEEDEGEVGEEDEEEEIEEEEIEEEESTRKGIQAIARQETRPDRETFLAMEPSLEPLRLLVGIGLDPGIARKDVPNEDNLFAIQGMRPTDAGPEPMGLFIVADGMGGHAHGQEASKLAVHAISDAIVPTLMRQVDREEDFLSLLKDGVHRANLAIYRRNREQEHMMGTTLTAVLVVARTAYIVNVGDSRTYIYRPSQGLRQVTRDHSVVARLVEDGAISREDIYTHPKRNQIYRCLGERAAVEVEHWTEPLQADDVLVLCSDGLWEMVHDDEMEGIIASSAAYPSQMSKLLIQSALMRGGADNISVIVAYVAQMEGR